MNKINESKRLREAAEYQAETAKLVKVKEAEAEAISKRLQGEGVANQVQPSFLSIFNLFSEKSYFARFPRGC